MRQRGEVPGDDLQAGSVGGVDEAADRGRMDDIARLAVVRRLQVERGDAVRPKRCHDRVGVAPGLLREDVDPGAEAAVDGGRLGPHSRARGRRGRKHRGRNEKTDNPFEVQPDHSAISAQVSPC